MYVYLLGCTDCTKAEPYIKKFAETNNVFVLDVEKAKDRKRYDWNTHFTENDIEIGVIDDQGYIVYYDEESNEKYEEIILLLRTRNMLLFQQCQLCFI